jgi:hypothetical protein
MRIDRQLRRHDEGTFDDVLQLADVARPGISVKQLRGPRVDAAHSLLRHPTAVHEVFDEQRSVLLSVAQRRHLDREYVQSVEEISTECARRNGRRKVPVRGGNHTHVGGDWVLSAHALELSLLENA